MDHYRCPICNLILTKTRKTYSTNELIKLWNIDFSEGLILELKSQTEETSLYECDSCKLGIFLPLLFGTPNFYNELISKTGYYVDDKWDFTEALKEANGALKILEIGCGSGIFLDKCKALGIECYGTEYNQEAVKIVESKGITILDEKELNDRRETFDAVFSFHVLEHAEDPISFIEFQASMVKPSGKICISVPNQDGPIKYIEPCISNMPPHHLTRWKLKTLKVIGEKMQLKIDRVSYEPLLLSNHSYYSHYLINSVIKSSSKFAERIRELSSSLLTKFFDYQINKKMRIYYPHLKGQAIYVVFKK